MSCRGFAGTPFRMVGELTPADGPPMCLTAWDEIDVGHRRTVPLDTICATRDFGHTDRSPEIHPESD